MFIVLLVIVGLPWRVSHPMDRQGTNAPAAANP
jgi:hypothetical protein